MLGRNFRVGRGDVNGPGALCHRIGIGRPVPDDLANALVILRGIVERALVAKAEIARQGQALVGEHEVGAE